VLLLAGLFVALRVVRTRSRLPITDEDSSDNTADA
jgi:hypothetical protein